jgi:hypothetical protein
MSVRRLAEKQPPSFAFTPDRCRAGGRADDRRDHGQARTWKRPTGERLNIVLLNAPEANLGKKTGDQFAATKRGRYSNISSISAACHQNATDAGYIASCQTVRQQTSSDSVQLFEALMEDGRSQ